MELIEIAQLVTGIATLIVASVLIWQMFIQKRTLDIAHRDADSSISLDAISHRANLNMWFSDKCDQEFIDKLNSGLDSLNNKDKEIITTWLMPSITILNTEYRLGRLDRSPFYYKASIRRFLRYKAFQEIFPSMPFMKPGTALHPNLVSLIKEVYLDISGKKFELSS